MVPKKVNGGQVKVSGNVELNESTRCSCRLSKGPNSGKDEGDYQLTQTQDVHATTTTTISIASTISISIYVLLQLYNFYVLEKWGTYFLAQISSLMKCCWVFEFLGVPTFRKLHTSGVACQACQTWRNRTKCCRDYASLGGTERHM